MSTSRPTRAAVVGAGRIANEHLTAIDAFRGAQLVAVCDANRTLAEVMATRYGGVAYDDLGELLTRAQADVLHVLTPPHLHVPMAMAALDAGLHVIVEKPMALEREGRERLLAAAARSGRLLVEDHNYRFNRPMLQLEHDLAAGHLGSLVDVAVEIVMPLGAGSRYGDRNLPSPSHRMPAGFIHEFITHLAYLAVTLLPDAAVVEARWARRLDWHPSPYDELDATLRSRGVTGRLRFSSLGPRSLITVRATGTQGQAEAEMILGTYRVERPLAVGDQLSPPVNALLAGARTAGRGIGYVADRLRGRTAYEGLHELVRRFHRAVGTGSSPPLRPDDLRRTGDLVDDLVATMPRVDAPTAVTP
jgi:predicted dehydrogenase